MFDAVESRPIVRARRAGSVVQDPVGRSDPDRSDASIELPGTLVEASSDPKAALDPSMDIAVARGAIDLPLGEPEESLSGDENGADESGRPDDRGESMSFDAPSIGAAEESVQAATGVPSGAVAAATDPPVSPDHAAADETLDSTAIIDSAVRRRPPLDIDLGNRPVAVSSPPTSAEPGVLEALREPLPRARSLTSFVPGGRPIPLPLGSVDAPDRTPEDVETAFGAMSDSIVQTAELAPGHLSDVICSDLAVAASQTMTTVDDAVTELRGAGDPIPVSEDWPVSMARRRGGFLGRVYTRLVSFLRRVPRMLGLQRRSDED